MIPFLILIGFLALTFMVACELEVLTAILLLGGGALSCWYFEIPLRELAQDNWLQVLVFTACYILIGALYSVPKWMLFGKKLREKLDDYIKSGNPIPQYSSGMTWGDMTQKMGNWNPRIPNLKVTVSGNPPYKVQFDIPLVENKSRLTSWMIFWPFSLTATLAEDFVVKIYERLYRALSELYTRITAHTFRDLN